MQVSLVVRRGLPVCEFAFDDEKFSGIQRGENGKKIRDVGVARDFEFASREIEPRSVKTGLVE
jgi:hypothetical protein